MGSTSVLGVHPDQTRAGLAEILHVLGGPGRTPARRGTKFSPWIDSDAVIRGTVLATSRMALLSVVGSKILTLIYPNYG